MLLESVTFVCDQQSFAAHLCSLDERRLKARDNRRRETIAPHRGPNIGHSIGNLFGHRCQTVDQPAFVNTNLLSELAPLPQTDIANPILAADLHRQLDLRGGRGLSPDRRARQ